MSSAVSDPAIRQPKPARRKPVPLAFWLHSLFGLKLSLFLGFVSLTGTIATVSHEIEWLYKPAVRATTVIGHPDWGRMWDAAQRAYPNTTLGGIGSYDRNDEPYFAKSVSATDEDGEDFAIYVDPGTSRVTGHEYGRSFQDAMRGFFRMPRWSRGGRTLMGGLHRLAGLWSLWFVAIIGLTSVWCFAEHAGVEWNTPPPRANAIDKRMVTGAHIRVWTHLAQREMPGLAITAVKLPYEAGDPVIVQGQWKALLVRERTNAVFIDPLTGQLLGKREAHKLDVGERIVHTADPLHFGTFGGLVTKLTWVVFGLMLVGMSASGVYIYAKRMKLALGADRSLLGRVDKGGISKRAAF